MVAARAGAASAALGGDAAKIHWKEPESLGRVSVLAQHGAQPGAQGLEKSMAELVGRLWTPGNPRTTDSGQEGGLKESGHVPEMEKPRVRSDTGKRK